MADGDAEVITRVQREAAIKDISAVIDKHARSLNKVSRKVQLHLTSDSIDVKAVQVLSEQYESIVDSISNVFKRIVDLSEGAPPEEVKVDFKRIDIESCKFMSEVSAQIRELRKQDSFDRSKSQEREKFESQTQFQVEQSEAISKLCSQMVLGRLPAPEPDVFSGDPLKFTAWFNSFQTLITSR